MKKIYTLDRIWMAIKRDPGSKSKSIAYNLQWPRRRVWNGLYSLRRKGLARVEGKGLAARWYAMGKKPACNWGMHENSINNLLAVPEAERMARLGVSRRVVPPRIRPSSCELENCMRGLNIARTSWD